VNLKLHVQRAKDHI